MLVLFNFWWLHPYIFARHFIHTPLRTQKISSKTTTFFGYEPNTIIAKHSYSFQHLSEKFISLVKFWMCREIFSNSQENNFSQRSFPPLLSDDQIISTTKGKSKLFAKQFAAIYQLSIDQHVPFFNCKLQVQNARFQIKS